LLVINRKKFPLFHKYVKKYFRIFHRFLIHKIHSPSTDIFYELKPILAFIQKYGWPFFLVETFHQKYWNREIIWLIIYNIIINGKIIFFFQDALFSFFGFLFFISSGSLLIRDSDVLGIKVEYTPSMRALGSLQIINSLLYLVDFVFSAMNIAKKE